MADPHDDPAMETRLSEYLAGELRRAEDDYPRMHLVRRSAARRRPLTRVALFAVVAALVVLFAGALVVKVPEATVTYSSLRASSAPRRRTLPSGFPFA